MENWYDAFGDNWAERLGNISSVTSPQMTGWARFGGRLIDEGNNPRPKKLPIAESYTSLPGDGFAQKELPIAESYTSLPGDGFAQKEQTPSYAMDYAQKLESTRKFNPTAGASLDPGPGTPEPEPFNPYKSGGGQAEMATRGAENQMAQLQQMGAQQQAQSQQQGQAIAGLATQALSAAGYSI